KLSEFRTKVPVYGVYMNVCVCVCVCVCACEWRVWWQCVCVCVCVCVGHTVCVCLCEEQAYPARRPVLTCSRQSLGGACKRAGLPERLRYCSRCLLNGWSRRNSKKC